MSFWIEVLNEVIEFVFIAIIALLGVFAGIALRKRKDKKDAEGSVNEVKTETSTQE